MSEPIFELAWDAFQRHLPYHHPGATMIAAPAQAQPLEAPVSLLTEVKTGLHDVVGKLEGIDEEAVAKLEAISANPGAVEVMNVLSGVLHVPANGLTLAVNVLKDLGALWDKPAPAEAAPAPAQ
jgi:hypothetical protein